ncbi:hypothetical protein [Sinanaerobacter chloroacetimidivorans]|jgi:uncharacterized membrane protein YkvI|uniref:Membrane protein YkvI n=1 Tax=Sinanaerobacter chloroacetimidivorans TaxID=2818044 RepID=A0A8J7W739_9FIRM|nr:hypothetical protein [Sinanaerobacter chloroacetimidivorans]MBR0600125.1 hypothetical protein [Sinanaerobacter chloroacetimidivorans]
MNRHSISSLNIALLYVGTLMGAGFASGREIWQFFSVFGKYSYPAVLMVTMLFILFGLMTVKISIALDTTEIGKVIMPFAHKGMEKLLGSITAVILFLVYIVMAAAGGALFQEQFGFHRIIGGSLLMVLVLATVLGGFERISKYFRLIIPILLLIVFFVCFNIIFRDLPVSHLPVKLKISPMAPSWYTAAVIYISYNMLAGIPILANSTQRARTHPGAFLGAAAGGILLGFSAFIMNRAMLSDPGISSGSLLPILSLAGKLNPVLLWTYAALLLFAVYASASSNFYGFTTMLKDDTSKKYKIIGTAFIGFLLSLLGFGNIIAFILPLEGYCGILFLLLMTVNYIRIATGHRSVNMELTQYSEENNKHE